MAYLAFPDLGGIAAVRQGAEATAEPSPVGSAGRLSALEWSVVMIARRDRLSSLRRPGRLAVALGTLFDRRNPALADARLEALRRIAVLAWHADGAVPEAEVRAFLRAGFEHGQYETLIASIQAARTASSDRSRAPETRRRGALSARLDGVGSALKSDRPRSMPGRP